MPRACLILLAAMAASAPAVAAAQAYNPYAGPREPAPPPLAADGTIQWGTFYKSAAIQQSYERLWNLGACRGTNKAITKPVESNKLLIDNLPESEFHGTVKAVTGSLAGGLIAYTEDDGTNPDAPVYVAQLHPAGVTALSVTGPASQAAVIPGVTIKVVTTVDAKGRGRDPVTQVEIVTPPAGFTPDAVEPDRACTAVGRVISRRGDVIVVQVDAGKHRRLALRLADSVTVSIAAAELELVSPGDSLQLVGRRWSGDGSMAAGTVFASNVSIAKQPPQAD